MNLTTKNISKFQTPDGHAWSASFYLDGKKIGTAHDQGHGGEVDTRGLDKAAYQAISAYAKTLPHFGQEHGMDLEQNVDMVLENCVFDTLEQRRSKRLLKAKVVARLSDGKVYEWKTQGRVAEVKVQVLKKHPDAIILNDLPFDEAHKILTAP